MSNLIFVGVLQSLNSAQKKAVKDRLEVSYDSGHTDGFKQGNQDGHTQAKEVITELDEIELLKAYNSGYSNGIEDTVAEFELGNAFTQNLYEEAFNEGFEVGESARQKELRGRYNFGWGEGYKKGIAHMEMQNEIDKYSHVNEQGCDEDECSPYEFGAVEDEEHKYPHYFKSVRHLDYIDVYMVNKLFPSNDDTGCIDHAKKKLMVSGGRGGGKLPITDVIEARDTLNRYLEILEQSGEI